ncbi:regucalcin-like [Xenia sp. Carnegie-2017]|uniref:regucalcin-like n=1 Tax=Xenia sp. Carnegie-2017 TaxID=2897299 RepID=UPI001F039421|nr:regucalcin-like [Xenia sp. Carnegie-2017]
MAKVECAFDASGYKVGLGEGPHWDVKNQRLFWLDILDRSGNNGKTLHIYDPISGSDHAIALDVSATSVITRENITSSLAVTYDRHFAFLDIETGKLEVTKTVDDDKPGNRFNDGKCDPAGRYWAGTMGPEPVPTHVVPYQGSIFCLDGISGTVEAKSTPYSLSNGMGWSADSKTMYFIDTLDRKLYGFDFDLHSASITNKRTVVEFDEGWPDGMCVDSEDKLWVAVYDTSKVVRYDPKDGSVLMSVTLPVTKLTSCCWGGSNLDELYVTSARECLGEDRVKKEPLAGSLFKVSNLGCSGVPPNEFNG